MKRGKMRRNGLKQREKDSYQEREKEEVLGKGNKTKRFEIKQTFPKL